MPDEEPDLSAKEAANSFEVMLVGLHCHHPPSPSHLYLLPLDVWGIAAGDGGVGDVRARVCVQGRCTDVYGAFCQVHQSGSAFTVVFTPHSLHESDLRSSTRLQLPPRYS